MVTCFFIDTAPNILEYIQVIHKILKPAGVWINGGPLLWHWQKNEAKAFQNKKSSENDVRYSQSIELCYEQLKDIIINVGFNIIEEQWYDTNYTCNHRSMMRTVYHIVQFVAIKT